MKKNICIGFLLVSLGATAAMADMVSDRQDLMKSFGGPSRALGGMARAPDTFDPAAAKTQLQILVDGAAKIPTLFPAGSETSATAKTLALPTVWSDKAGFDAAAAKFGADATAAMAATDATTFQAAYTKVQGDCNACHMTYRERVQRPAGAPGGGPGGAPGGGPAGAPPGPPPAQ